MFHFYFMLLTFTVIVSANPFDSIFGVKIKPNGKRWALLVSTNAGWGNYADQANVCHAYHIMHDHGIPDEQIVVMIYDDVVNDPINPYPGKLINQPHGKDVYHGVPKDYIGADITASNVLEILKGNQEHMRGIGSGKVIESGPNDHVFLYTTDHGDDKLLVFATGPPLAKYELNRTLDFMISKKKFDKMLIYTDACESGSMYNGSLPGNANIYATTAAPPDRSAFRTFCGIQPFNGSALTCLSNQYSFAWMNDTDHHNLYNRTVEEQFQYVKIKDNESIAEQYGDMRVSRMKLEEFFGPKNISINKMNTEKPSEKYESFPICDMHRNVLQNKYKLAKTVKKQGEIKKEINQIDKKRKYFDNLLESFAEKFESDPEKIENLLNGQTNLDTLEKMRCHHILIQAFHYNVYDFAKNPYTTKASKLITNLCDRFADDTETIENAIKEMAEGRLEFEKGII